MTGVMSSNISSCYKVHIRQKRKTYNDVFLVQVDQIWSNSTLLESLPSVPTYEECQALCRVIIFTEDDILIIMLKYSGQGRVRGLDLAVRDQC